MKTFKLIFSLVFLCGVISQPAFSQRTLTLRGCLKFAEENNLLVKQSRNSEASASLNYMQAKAAFFPSVSASLQGNKYLGTSVDPFSLTVNQSPVNGSFNANATLPLFNGFSRWHNLRSTDYTIDAAHEATAALLNDILSQVTLIYFQVLFDQENYKISSNKLALLEKQVERVQAQFDAGTKTQGDLYNIKSQAATEKVTNVTAKNQMQKDLLTLLQLLDLDPSETYELEKPTANVEVETGGIPPIDSVYNAALAEFPDVREKQYRVLAAEENMDVSRASLYPSMSLSFSSGTNYSSGRKELLFDANGLPYYGDRIALDKQVSDYWNNGITMGISIPVFQNFRNRISYKQSQITYDNAQIGLEQTQNQLVKEIQQAYLDLQAAGEKYKAAVENLGYLTESFKYMESKFEAGLIDFYSYSEMLNSKTSAETGVSQSRYDFLLKKKILDLYMGVEISF